MSDQESTRESTLSDTKATLRQVDDVLSDFTGVGAGGTLGGASASPHGSPVGLVGMAELLEKTFSEVARVIEDLRESRSLLERAAVARVRTLDPDLQAAALQQLGYASGVLMDAEARMVQLAEGLSLRSARQGPSPEAGTATDRDDFV